MWSVGLRRAMGWLIMRAPNCTLCWAFWLFHPSQLFVPCKAHRNKMCPLLYSHSEAWPTFLHAAQVDPVEPVLRVCWQGHSVHVWGRGWGAELMFPDPASNNSSKQSNMVSGRPQHSLNGAKRNKTVVKSKFKKTKKPSFPVFLFSNLAALFKDSCGYDTKNNLYNWKWKLFLSCDELCFIQGVTLTPKPRTESPYRARCHLWDE